MRNAMGAVQGAMLLQALRIAAIPCEVFAETGLAIKQQSHSREVQGNIRIR